MVLSMKKVSPPPRRKDAVHEADEFVGEFGHTNLGPVFSVI